MYLLKLCNYAIDIITYKWPRPTVVFRCCFIIISVRHTRIYEVSQLNLSYDKNKKRKELEFSSYNNRVLLIQEHPSFGVIKMLKNN